MDEVDGEGGGKEERDASHGVICGAGSLIRRVSADLNQSIRSIRHAAISVGVKRLMDALASAGNPP